MNLLTFSEQFDNAAWSKARASISANATAAPDGTTTADKLVEDTSASNTHQAFRSTSVSAGTPHTFSVYIKADGRNFAGVRYENTGSTEFYQVNVNLTNGTATTSSFGSPTGTSFSVTNAGNAWWRVSITVTTSNTGFQSVVYLQSVQGSNNYTGDGVSGAFIWGAQLEVGSTATTYNSTTVKNLLGFTENFDNAAWTKSNAFVQTNLVAYSQQFDNAAWVLDNAGAVNPVVTANAGEAPNGTFTADRIVLNKTGGTFSRISQLVAAVTGVNYTFSVWLKTFSGGTSNVGVRLVGVGINAVVTGEWQRFTVTASSTGTSVDGQILLFDSIPGNDETADVLAWGAQVVQGTSAGDYKATYAAAAAVGYTDIYGQPFAQKLVEDTANNTHFVNQIAGSVGSVEVRTIYAKAAERAWLYLGIGATSFAYFNLASGATGTVNAGTASITAVGDGWFRCSLAATRATNLNNVTAIASSNGGISYTGDGTSGIYIFGAQLSDSASVDPYVYQPVAAPSSVAYYGPRFDYDASTATITENYGPELITNGDFSNGATGWILNPTGSNVITISDGAVRFQATGADTATLSQTGVTTAGKFYKVEFDVLPGSSGQLKVLPFGTSGEIVFSCTPGRKTFGTTVATSTSFQISRVVGQVADAYIDNITVTEYLGITSTGATPKGLLIEEQRTNLLTYSEDFSNAAWTPAGTVTPNVTLAPDGTLTADRCAVISGAALSQIVNSITAGINYTISVWVKSSATGGASNVRITTNNTGAWNTGISQIYALTSDWQRITISGAIISSGTSVRLLIGSYTVGGGGDATCVGNIDVWGAQLEAGAFATSYIPTVASQVTRAADNASMIGNNFARWYNQTEGTVYSEANAVALSATAGNPGTFVGISDGTVSNRLRLKSENGSVWEGAVAGTSQFAIGAYGAAGVSYKLAGAYKANDFAYSFSGTTAATDTSGTVPFVSQMQIGNLITAREFNGAIKRIAYYNRRMSNTELQGITS